MSDSYTEFDLERCRSLLTLEEGDQGDNPWLVALSASATVASGLLALWRTSKFVFDWMRRRAKKSRLRGNLFMKWVPSFLKLSVHSGEDPDLSVRAGLGLASFLGFPGEDALPANPAILQPEPGRCCHCGHVEEGLILRSGRGPRHSTRIGMPTPGNASPGGSYARQYV